MQKRLNSHPTQGGVVHFQAVVILVCPGSQCLLRVPSQAPGHNSALIWRHSPNASWTQDSHLPASYFGWKITLKVPLGKPNGSSVLILTKTFICDDSQASAELQRPHFSMISKQINGHLSMTDTSEIQNASCIGSKTSVDINRVCSDLTDF